MRADRRLALALCAALALAGCQGDDDDGGGGGGRCTVIRPSSTGPGDVSDHFPLSFGDSWRYQETATGGAATEVVVTVTGTRAVDGVTASVVTSTPVGAVEPPGEEFIFNGPSGVSVHDPFVAPPLDEMYPYVMMRWPLSVGDAYSAVSCTGLDLGEDLDGDGRPERMDASVSVSVGGDEAVVVPAGAFTARRVTGVTRLTIRATSGQTATGIFQEVRWFAPGVGMVRATIATSGDVPYESVERVLESYTAGGVSRGTQPAAPLAGELDGEVAPAALAPSGDRPPPRRPFTAWPNNHRALARLLDAAAAAQAAAR